MCERRKAGLMGSLALVAAQPSLLTLVGCVCGRAVSGVLPGWLEGVSRNPGINLLSAILGVLAIDMALRLALVISLVMHEWAHLAAALVLCKPDRRSHVLTLDNFQGGLSVRDWVTFLTPLALAKVGRFIMHLHVSPLIQLCSDPTPCSEGVATCMHPKALVP